jgi:phosphate transport system substrate-binding protein
MRRSFVIVRTALLVAAMLTTTLAFTARSRPASAASHAQINGSGSTWSYNAVNAWISEVSAQGLRVTFTGNGSAAGRQDFANRAVDFAVSDIGYQGQDPLTHTDDTPRGRGYAYIPLVAGGTAFPYHIIVAGKPVTNLRLSGQTLTKIFTNKITNWNDAAITADNNGHALPSIPIVPIVHSEGSGTSFQFSAYMAQQFPNLWGPFAGAAKPTEYWPCGKGQQICQNGSDQLMNYITSGSGQGTIGYDEYSYAIAKGVPAAKILNADGYYTLPTQYNVAVALTQAIINMDKSSPNYLLQNLHNVYGYKDSRTYPLSSYSYGVIPTAANDQTMSTPKRQTLADFLYASICQGQGTIGQIGFSALPINLVQAGFQQIALLHAADGNVDLTRENVSTCGNPTFVANHPTENHLAQVAPAPAACDRVGQGPCGTGGTAAGNTAGGSGGGGAASGSVGTAGGGSGTTASGSSKGSTVSAAGAPSSLGGSGTSVQAPVVDPATGAVLGTTTAAGSGLVAAAQPTTLAASAGASPALAVLAVLLLLGALIAPPVLARRWPPPQATR